MSCPTGLRRALLVCGLVAAATPMHGLGIAVTVQAEPVQEDVRQIQPIPMPVFPSRDSSPWARGEGRGSSIALNQADIGAATKIPATLGRTVPWSIVVMLTVLTLVPSILICMTPFARLLIVFHFLRQALGLQTTPSNQTLIGLSVILTFFLMQPVASQIYKEAAVPMQAGEITPIEALERAAIPMHKFMGHYVREKDVALFVQLAKEPRPASVDDLSMRVLLPAYILSEIKGASRLARCFFFRF